MKIKCCLCGEKIEEKDSHNAEPIVEKGRCCAACNWSKVTPTRIKIINENRKRSN